MDGDGFIDIWDINKDTESPIVHKKAFESAAGNAAYRDYDDNKAICSLKWSLDGRKLAIGDSDGFLSIWNVDKELYNPKQSDFELMEQLCQNLRHLLCFILQIALPLT